MRLVDGKSKAPGKVTITQQLGAPPLALLERALDEAGFWPHLVRERAARATGASAFRVIIKPDLDFYDAGTPGGTDPALVEHLIDLLHDHGCTDVVVGDGRNECDSWLHNRGALVVPDLVGYRFTTPKGRAYEIVDLGTDPPDVEVPAPDSPPRLSVHWRQAGYRINFAKNRTHEECVFALCTHNLAGVVISGDARGGSRTRSLPDDCLAALRIAPPDFNLIDAYVSCHGGAGQRAPRPMETHAFIGSTSALLADWVAAAKMGVDPHASPVNAAALRALGLPHPHQIVGDLGPWPLWSNVHPLIARSASQRSRHAVLGAIAPAWFQTVDRVRFPHKDFFSDRINSFVAPWMADVDANPRSFWSVVLLNQAIAWIDGAIESQRTLFAKDRLRRRFAPLRLDPAAIDRGEFEAIPAYLQPFERILAGAPPNAAGMRWRRVDGSVLFEGSHVFPIAFDAFVAAVDITRSIQYMNDYIGGSTVPVRRDDRHRVIHQAERNLYLQQPNWMALFGGDLIDVEKIELIRYAADRHEIAWRTLQSPNESARLDDGIVSFADSGPGQTAVRIFARQAFSLPTAFRIFDVDLAPEIRDPIIDSAYATFFRGTIANLQAAHDGREFRIGRDAGPEDAVGSGARMLATAAAAVAELVRHRHDVAELGQFFFGGASAGQLGTLPAGADRDGFRHFGPQASGTTYLGVRADAQAAVAGIAALARDAPDFVAGLADAVRRDLEAMAGSADEAAR